jgi:epimerase transport system membrane fusion protein
LIHGTVAQVSADRLTDERTGLAYYLAEVSIDRKELAASPEIELYPGMPATVMVTTEERTALDYLLGPIVASLDQSFRQK